MWSLLESDETRLSRLFELAAGSASSGLTGVDWAESLFRWVLGDQGPRFLLRGSRTSRLALLERALAHDPRREAAASLLKEAFGCGRSVRVLSEMGLPDSSSVVVESFGRFVDAFVPRIDPHPDAYTLLERLDLGKNDAEWFACLPDDLVDVFAPLARPTKEDVLTAAELLALRAAGAGLSRELLDLATDPLQLLGPFRQLVPAVRDVSAKVRAGENPDPPEALASCVAILAVLKQGMEVRGVKADPVFSIEVVSAQLQRIRSLLEFASGKGDGFALTREIVRGAVLRRSFSLRLRTSTKLLAMKVAEYSSETGEPHVSETLESWKKAGWAAAGAGALTAIVGYVNLRVAVRHFPLLIEALFFSANYALGFILMQLLGLGLAAKHPAITASSLAHSLDSHEGPGQTVALVASITRTQVALTAGNIALAVPVAFLLEFLGRQFWSISVLTPQKALVSVESLNPFGSGTIVFAALTGLALWLGSLASGWGANWMAFRNFQEAMRQSPRLASWIGRKATARVALFLSRHLSGFLGCLFLGTLFGLAPPLASLFGVGLETRHVSFSAASWGMALSWMLGKGGMAPLALLWALGGVLIVGVFNFLVSGALALHLATTARGLDWKKRQDLVRALLEAFGKDPLSFFIPPNPSIPPKPTSAGPADGGDLTTPGQSH